MITLTIAIIIMLISVSLMVLFRFKNRVNLDKVTFNSISIAILIIGSGFSLMTLSYPYETVETSGVGVLAEGPNDEYVTAEVFYNYSDEGNVTRNILNSDVNIVYKTVDDDVTPFYVWEGKTSVSVLGNNYSSIDKYVFYLPAE